MKPSTKTMPKTLESPLQKSEPQSSSSHSSARPPPPPPPPPRNSSCLFTTSYNLFKVLLFATICFEVLITVFEHFETLNITPFQAMEHHLFGVHFTDFCTASLGVSLFGLAALLAPITRVGGQVLLTLCFFYSEQAVLALLFVDQFRPDPRAVCPDGPGPGPGGAGDNGNGIDNGVQGVAILSCGLFGGLKLLTTQSLLFSSKLVSLVVGLLYLLQVMVKHGSAGEEVLATKITQKKTAGSSVTGEDGDTEIAIEAIEAVESSSWKHSGKRRQEGVIVNETQVTRV